MFIKLQLELQKRKSNHKNIRMSHKIKKKLLEHAANNVIETHEAKKAFCESTGISYYKLQNWWNDEGYRIKSEDLYAAADFFECSIDELLGRELPKPVTTLSK